MPSPFTLYWTTFYLDDPDSDVPQDKAFDNASAIYNIIKSSNLTISDYAIYGIISASWIISGLNPARFEADYYTVSQNPPEYADGEGLWLDDNNISLDGYEQTQQLISNIEDGAHYHAYRPDLHETPTLSEYLAYNDDNRLAWWWIVSYSYYHFIKDTNKLTPEYQDYCALIYDRFKTYIETHPRKLNPAFIAFLKKRKKRWWM